MEEISRLSGNIMLIKKQGLRSHMLEIYIKYTVNKVIYSGMYFSRDFSIVFLQLIRFMVKFSCCTPQVSPAKTWVHLSLLHLPFEGTK